MYVYVFFFKQKTAYEMRISDWSSDVCSSDLTASGRPGDEERTTTTHPAFAQISASRVTGLANLYGSDFAHQSYVRIRVNPSEMHRSLANDWPHAGRTDRKSVV